MLGPSLDPTMGLSWWLCTCMPCHDAATQTLARSLARYAPAPFPLTSPSNAGLGKPIGPQIAGRLMGDAVRVGPGRSLTAVR